MSRDMHLCCLDCKQHIWIGQTDVIYSGMPDVMELLREFLVTHRTYAPRYLDESNYHELLYMPEPYNGSFEGVEWNEIEVPESPSPNQNQQLEGDEQV
jgi:hypothetical protein